MTQYKYKKLKKQTDRYRKKEVLPPSPHPSFRQDADPDDGYPAFFRLRCLVCFVFFLALAVFDQRIGLKEYPATERLMEYLKTDTFSLPTDLF